MTNKPKVKTTYTMEQFHILLLKEAFKRDLPLFKLLLEKKTGFFNDQPMLKPGTTFTVVTTGESSELFINSPSAKSK